MLLSLCSEKKRGNLVTYFQSFFAMSPQRVRTFLMLAGAMLHIGTATFAYAEEETFVGIGKSSTARILDTFKGEQKKMLFETSPFDEKNVLGLFDMEKDLQKLEESVQNISEDTDEYRMKRRIMVHRRMSLEETVQDLDQDILQTEQFILRTEREIRITNVQIRELVQKIEDLEAKIASNKKAILEYLSYVYVKGDTLYGTSNEVDIVRGIILSDGNLSDIFNDIHHKSLVEIAGQNFIEKHRALVREYYEAKQQVQLQKQQRLAMRHALNKKTKELGEQKKYKEYLLEVTKGKEELYTKYIIDKMQVEGRVRNQMEVVQSEYNAVFATIGKKLNCNKSLIFANGGLALSGAVAKPTGTGAVQEWKMSGTGSEKAAKDAAIARIVENVSSCDELKMFYEAEKQLKKSDFDAERPNPFNWPVKGMSTISTYFHDSEYYAILGSEHEAIDVPVDQGTAISAPADGYVYFVLPPAPGGYSYVAIKHSNGYMTVYGHLSETYVKKFDYVRSGQVFARTGGARGTPGAGVMTSGPHLHFETYRNGTSIDPLRLLDTTVLRFDALIGKYKFKYVQDLKVKYGKKANTSGYETFIIQGKTETDRQKNLLAQYSAKAFNDWGMWVEESIGAKIDPSFLMCVGLAESGLGRSLKTGNNVGNIGNTDSGGTYTFDTPREGVYWMARTLNNQYLGKYDTIDELSRWGNKEGSIYASSSSNWHNNLIRCISALKDRFIEDDFKFRLEDGAEKDYDIPRVQAAPNVTVNQTTVASTAKPGQPKVSKTNAEKAAKLKSILSKKATAAKNAAAKSVGKAKPAVKKAATKASTKAKATAAKVKSKVSSTVKKARK